jgi:hypothetical protein
MEFPTTRLCKKYTGQILAKVHRQVTSRIIFLEVIMNALKSMLSDGTNDSISSKRVITFLSFLLCATAFIGNTWFETKIDAGLFNSMMYIVIGGLGFTASEKFAAK